MILGLNRGLMQHEKDRQMMRMIVQYLDCPTPVDESDAVVVPTHAYNFVLGSPQSEIENPDIDRAHRRLASLRSPSVSGVEEMTPTVMAVASKGSEGEN